MLYSRVLEDRAAVVTFNRFEFVYLRFPATFALTVNERVCVSAFPGNISARLALGGPVLLGVFSQPLLTSGGGPVERFPKVQALPLQVNGALLVELDFEVLRLGYLIGD
jgi:hypothetical protein